MFFLSGGRKHIGVQLLIFLKPFWQDVAAVFPVAVIINRPQGGAGAAGSGNAGGGGGSGTDMTPFFGAAPQPVYGPTNGIYASGGGSSTY